MLLIIVSMIVKIKMKIVDFLGVWNMCYVRFVKIVR